MDYTIEQASVAAQVLAVLLLAAALGIAVRGVYKPQPGESAYQRQFRLFGGNLLWWLHVITLACVLLSTAIVVVGEDIPAPWGILGMVVAFVGLVTGGFGVLIEIRANFRGDVPWFMDEPSQ